MGKQRILILLALTGAAFCRADLLTPAWVELGEHGVSIVRVVVTDPDACPTITIDGAARQMTLRTPVPAALRPLCETTLPPDAKAASIGAQRLPLPNPEPSKVLVLGDTGCRIKGGRVQDCNDPERWPFERVSAQAADELPDLVIHVGDYLYREDICPKDSSAKCAGTPSGDNWETWNADFFAPAAKLLAAAPWAPVRGNHEDCNRAWRGWFYYLDPRPWQGETCAKFTEPYSAGNVTPHIVMFDSSPVSEDRKEDATEERLAAQFASIQENGAWLVAHHPIWAIRPAKEGDTVPVSAGFQRAWQASPPRGIDMILSGHTHLFELLTFDEMPTQLVAGIGGTQLSAPLPSQFDGLKLGSKTILMGESQVEFGYVLLVKKSGRWNLTLKNSKNRVLESCDILTKQTSCGHSSAAIAARP
ncbi:MAG: metallophosphoesterase [Bryobacteraceae bacterium]